MAYNLLFTGIYFMIRDHRPLWFKRRYQWFERWYGRHFVEPHFAAIGTGALMMKPWNIRVFGPGICAGTQFHVVTAPDRQVSLSTWQFHGEQGRIELGNAVLLCPGVRIDAASKVSIGDNCMLAAGSYVTDADWHDLYDRTRPIGTTRAVSLANNVWLGDGATVCKGVTIGENSVIGAGSVVASDIPENVIAAGNPAQVIRALDPDQPITRRETLFENFEAHEAKNAQIDDYVLGPNTWLNWLRTLIKPRRGD